jgi:hypothetical protein
MALIPGIGAIGLVCDHNTTLAMLRDMGSAGNSSGVKSTTGNISFYNNGTNLVTVESLTATKSAVVAYIGNPVTLITYTIITDPNNLLSPNQTIDDLFTNSNSAVYSTSPDQLSAFGNTFNGECNNLMRAIPQPGLAGASGAGGTTGGNGAAAAGPGGISLPVYLLETAVTYYDQSPFFDWTFVCNKNEFIHFTTFYASDGINFSAVDSVEQYYLDNRIYSYHMPVDQKNGYLKLEGKNKEGELIDSKIIAIKKTSELKLFYNAQDECIQVISENENENCQLQLLDLNGVNYPLEVQKEARLIKANVSGLRTGIYIVKLNTDSDMQWMKFMR